MPSLAARHLVDADLAERWRAPRTDVLEEAAPAEGDDGELRFAMARGPFHRWERRVRTTPAADGRVEVQEDVDFRLAVPVWGPLFGLALKRRLRRGSPPGEGPPWWAPPQVLDARAATVLSLLCVLGVFAGYLGTLITQTVTFAARQFDASTTDQGTLLASVRIGVLLSLAIVAMADRRGRRRVLIAAVIGACLVTALGALAPGMVWLGTTQTFARALSTVTALLIGIVAVEEMPAGARAFAVSVLAMTAALGAGLCVANLLYADVAEGAWRGAYLVPLLAVWPAWRIGRRLPETRRFERHRLATADPRVPVGTVDLAPVPTPTGADDPTSSPTDPTGPAAAPVLDCGADGVAPLHRAGHRFDWARFVLLSVSGFLWSLFLAPAAQFLNEYLRAERGFSGVEITVFLLATNTPGGLGIIVGGRLADRRGRRLLGIIGVVGGVGFTVVSYLTWGWPLWASSVLAALIGSVAIPALGVYGPELFPTGQRGAVNGALQVLSVAGSSVGLLTAGWLADRLGSLGPAMAILAVGPALLVLLIAIWYPETAHRELEELNPVDRA